MGKKYSRDRIPVTRKEFLTYTGTAALTATAGCIGGGGGGDDSIGFATVDDYSSAYSETGVDDRRGVELALMERDYEINGQEIEHHTSDTELDPGTAVSRMRDVIQSEDPVMVASSASSAVQQAMSEVSYDEETLFFTNGAATNLTGGAGHRYLFRWLPPSWTIARTAGTLAFEEIDVDTIYNLTLDYSFGYDISSQLEQIYEDFGIELLGEDLVPIGETDFNPYITNAMEEDPDAILVAQYGGNLTTALRQLNQSGAKEEAEIVSTIGGLSMFRGAGAEALSNTYSGVFWSHTLQDQIPWANDFVEAFRAQYDDDANPNPNPVAAASYAMTNNVLEAIDETGSTDNDDLIDYLEGLEFTGPTGEGEYIREWDHQVIHDYYLGYGTSPDEFSEEDENYLDIIDSGQLYPEKDDYEDPWRE